MRLNRKFQHGFTLIEMIVVMVITGIVGGMIAMLLRGPVQEYVDSTRRAEITDIADIAMSRITRDLRTAVPNSVRVSNTAGSAACSGTEICYLEYLEMVAGGRYITDASVPCFNTSSMVSPGVSCLVTVGDFGSVAAALATGASAVVSPESSVYTGVGIATITSSSAVTSGSNLGANVINFQTITPFSNSTHNRFQVVNTPVTYVCDPGAGTLTRYWDYSIQGAQPHTAATLNNFTGVQNAKLATNVSACNYTLQVPGLVTMYLTISESGESISLNATANVANAP